MIFLIVIIFLLLDFNQNVSAVFTAKDLGDLAVDLELGIVLAQHLKVEKATFSASLNILVQSMKAVEDAFYDQSVMINYCRDARNNEKSEILTAAFQKDLINPFTEKYHLKMLPLDELADEFRIQQVTFSELQASGKFNELLARIKSGRLKFKYECPYGYKAYLKTQIRQLITKKVTGILCKALEAQYQRSAGFKEISWYFNVFLTDYNEPLGSYLTMETARRIFVYSPYIRFIPRQSMIMTDENLKLIK